MPESLDAELAALVPLIAKWELTDFVAWRASMAASVAQSREAGRQSWRERLVLSDRSIPGPPGAPDVPVRIYRPPGDGVRPALVYLHGGAFVLGELEPFDSICAGYAEHADLVVVSVRYRLAPEDPFPAGAEDCYAALEWTAANAEALAIDPAAIAVGGSSAGGALAAAVALMARDRNGPAIALQLLLNPIIDDRVDTVSARRFGDTPLWDSGHVAVMWDLYLGPNRRVVSPYAAPGRGLDLTRLPPAYVLTSEFDPLRDEGLAYARRLLEAGVPVESHNFAGTFHAFDMYPTAISRRALTEQYAVLRHALHKA